MKERISNSVKDVIYKYFGFEFEYMKGISNYEDVYTSIDLGPIYEEICKYLELDSNKLCQ